MATRLTSLVAALAVTASIAMPLSAAQAADTKEAQRAALYPEVSKYLTQVAALEPEYLAPRLEFSNEGSLPRWIHKVCVRVSGLPEQDDRFIMQRIAEIGRDAGIRLGNEACKPNLVVIVTSQPKEMLTRMAKQDAWSWFGYRGRPYLLDQFIATPRPVRVWYNLSAGESIGAVVMLADPQRMKSVSLTQFADYVAMAGFVQVKPLAQLTPAIQVGAVPTILRLFDESANDAPAGLTDMDKALLTSLYANARPRAWTLKFAQVNMLTLNMVSQLAP